MPQHDRGFTTDYRGGVDHFLWPIYGWSYGAISTTFG